MISKLKIQNLRQDSNHVIWRQIFNADISSLDTFLYILGIDGHRASEFGRVCRAIGDEEQIEDYITNRNRMNIQVRIQDDRTRHAASGRCKLSIHIP